MNRLHPISAVLFALQYGFLWLWIPMFLLVFVGGALGTVRPFWMPVAAVLGFVAGASYGVGYYYRFGYRITDDTFDVASGVIARRSREIPYGRIQNVDIRQGVFQRLVGLATVSIETAGGGDTEAALPYVSEEEATRLQNEIRRRTAMAKGRRRRRRRQPAEGSDVSDTTDTADTSDTADTAGTVADERAIRDDVVGPEPASDHDPGVEPDEPGPSPTDDREPDPAAEPVSTGPESEPAEEQGLEAEDSRGERPRFGPGPGAGESVPDYTDDEFADEFVQPQRRSLFDLSSKELLLYSFTTLRPAAAAAVMFVFFLMTDTIVDLLIAIAQPVGGPEDLATGSPQDIGVLTVVSLVNAVVITYLLSVAYTFATYYGFRLGRVEDDFVYERGLLQRYSGSIPSEKVQSVTVTDNPAQRLIDYAGLWVETAGYGPESNGGSQSAVPLARRDRVYDFTENLTGVETPKFERPPTIARRRYLVRYSLVAAVVVAIAFGITQVTVLERWYLAAVVFAAVPVAAHLRYTHLQYYVGEDHLVVRRGFWRRRTTVIPYYRIQTISVRRSIFQRRLGICSVVVDTASSQTFFWNSPTIYDVDLANGRDVQTTCRKRLQSALRERAGSDDLGLEVDFT
ncbi:PH domain-containing protein [Natrarchaeobaculum aegyptiacum]|uniref:YdbS-like PH domain-containing protein n=1 Tax=Natrarchaeobaculum aegyptiacum TaxID=745377 RepID=A0A2Z2HWF0_9EURY|nr:PH domain-containing protein [Natrarchaeobaculum aegyptiacum]ARS91570.1 hypothetical protein B1756_18810 [Natrarchaeobaculum aegyptiacum]